MNRYRSYHPSTWTCKLSLQGRFSTVSSRPWRWPGNMWQWWRRNTLWSFELRRVNYRIYTTKDNRFIISKVIPRRFHAKQKWRVSPWRWNMWGIGNVCDILGHATLNSISSSLFWATKPTTSSYLGVSFLQNLLRLFERLLISLHDMLLLNTAVNYRMWKLMSESTVAQGSRLV